MSSNTNTSTSATEQGGFNAPHLKNRTEIKKDADQMYKTTFGDLPDGTIYRDPAGWKTRDGVELQKDRHEQLANEPVFDDGSSVIEKWNDMQRAGWSVEDTTQEIRKQLDTANWTLPLDIIPEVFTVQPEQLPMADMMTRVTTQDDEVVATPLTDHPSPSFGLENTGSTTDETYDYVDPSYSDLSFPVSGWGYATRLSDKLILSSQNLRNAESTQEQALVRGMQQYLERQIILGTNNDANGFDGFDDYIANEEGEVIETLDEANSPAPADYEDALRRIIDDAEFEGADRSSLAVVCGFDFYRNVKESLVNDVRYDAQDEVAGAFTTLQFEDVPVMKSNAITKISNQSSATTDTKAYTVNMEAAYLSVLQEMTVRPLARLGPQERFAVDSYATLTQEDNGEHIRAVEYTSS